MKKITTLLLGLVFVLSSYAQNTPVTKSNYELPARFTPDKMNRLSYSTNVNPHFLKNGNEFWYEYETSKGNKWYIVDALKGTKRVLFDNALMAAQISEISLDPCDAEHLPIKNIRFNDDGRSFIFEVVSSQDMTKQEREDYEEYRQKLETEDETVKKDSPMKKRLFLQYDIASGKVTKLPDYKTPYRNPSWASVSPDGETIIFARENNLYYMDKVNFEKAIKNAKDSTIVEQQITTDGTEDFSWGSSYGETNVDKKKNKTNRNGVYVIWSEDSKHFLINRSDLSKVEELWVINSIAKPRPTLQSYKYHMAGEANAPLSYLYLFDTATKKSKMVDVSAYKDQSFGVVTKDWKLTDREELNRKPIEWLGDNSKFYLSRSSRDMKKIDLCVVDINADSLKAKSIVEERMNTSMESRKIKLINDGKEIISWSQHSGWGHLYLYDNNGNMKRQITSGDFHVENVVAVDEAARTIYMIVNGFDKSENPYYTHLYKVGIDGGTPKQLTVNNFDNSLTVSDNNKYYINNFSRVNSVPQSVLCDMTGKTIMTLETADLSNLFAAGYKFPEQFIVKAADGVTDLYGVMYKPFDFDSTKLYPIIEYVYPGPQTEAVNTQYSRPSNRVDRLAQFGFIVVTVGNRGGHPSRSKWYHNYGYGNLRDYGLADKKAAVEQLADRFSFIDREKVGIHGHSGGGFMSTAAILSYPDFFKVAVSCAGNHENNIYNRWWSEKHHGIKEIVGEKSDTTFKYMIDKNSEIAKNLKGNLLLIHGDIDDNVHPANTLTVVDALIRANKRFDMLILPGQRHGFGDMDEYFFWKMGDYFSKHLIGDSQTTTNIPQMEK